MATPSVSDLVRELDLDARVRLVQDLWDAIADSVESQPLDAATRVLLDQRIAEYEANPDAVVPWEEVRAALFPKR